MKKKLNYALLLALFSFFVACSEKVEEEITPKVPEEEKELEDASISNFSPGYMIEGETIDITINGANFTENAQDVEVLLLSTTGEETKLTIKSVTNTQIKATATSIATIGEYSLQVNVKEKKITATEKFTVHGKIVVDPITGSSLEDGSYTIEVGGYLLLTGKNFSATAENNKVWLIDAEHIEKAATMVVSKADRLGFFIPETLPLGNYKIKIVTDVQESVLENKLIVEEATPSIESVSPTSLFAGEEIIITGKHFSSVKEENKVILKKNFTSVTLTITSASETKIIATIDSNTEAGEYSLSVNKNGKTTYYNHEKIVIKPSPTVPVITSINKTSFQKGETIIITGKNLKKAGVATNINFIPFYGGTTKVRSGIANAEGTEVQYTISDSFTSGSYEIVVEVDLEFSESYGDIIKIQ